MTKKNARYLCEPCRAPAVCMKNQTKYLTKKNFIWSDQNLCCEHKFDDMMDDVDLAVVSSLVHESSEQLIYHMYIKPALYKKILILHLPIISTSPHDYFLYQHCPRLLKILCQHCPRFFTKIANCAKATLDPKIVIFHPPFISCWSPPIFPWPEVAQH